MFRPRSQRTIIVALLASVFIITVNTLPQLPGGALIQEDAGQVSINERPDASTAVTNLPITVSIFSGTPGPKSCRGNLVTRLTLPRPEGPGVRTGPQCHNLPSIAGCANLVANKDDGCEARLFAEPGCISYVNTAVFIPENRAVGGLWRSFSVECGIPAPDPATLGAPPLQGMIQNIQKRPQG